MNQAQHFLYVETDEEKPEIEFFINDGSGYRKMDKPPYDWLTNRMIQCSDRYIGNENFIWSIHELPWYRKIFVGRSIRKHIKKMLDKYDF